MNYQALLNSLPPPPPPLFWSSVLFKLRLTVLRTAIVHFLHCFDAHCWITSLYTNVTYFRCLSVFLKISFLMWNLEACDGIPKGQSEMDTDYKLHSTGASVIWSHFALWLRNNPLTPHFVRWISLCHNGLIILIITTSPHAEKVVGAWHGAPNLIPHCC